MLAAIMVIAQHQNIQSVEAHLRKDLAAISGVQFTNDGQSLVVKYRTRIVQEGLARKSAKKMVEQESIERPTSTGFKLETYDFDHKRSEFARPMQAVRLNPNWIRDYGLYKVDAVERQIDGTDRARYYYLEWGSKADPSVIAAIRHAIETGTHPLKSYNGG